MGELSKTKRKSKVTDKGGLVHTTYVEPKPITKVYEQLPLKRLKANMVKTGRVLDVYMVREGSDPIAVEGSWVGLCITLLGTIYLNNPRNFLRVLLDNSVISSDFDVTTADVRFLSEEDKVKRYIIPGTDFSIISSMAESTIIKSITGMAKALDMNNDQVAFNIVPMDWSGEHIKTKREVKPVKTRIKTSYVPVDEVYATVVDGVVINKISILGNEKAVKSFYEATKKLVKYLLDEYGEETLKRAMVCNIQAVGISDSGEINCANIDKIKGSKLYIYSNNDGIECVKFICDICKYYGIDTQQVLLKVGQ